MEGSLQQLAATQSAAALHDPTQQGAALIGLSPFMLEGSSPACLAAYQRGLLALLKLRRASCTRLHLLAVAKFS